MKFITTPLPNAYLIELHPIQDDRGLFARTFCREEFQKIGHTKEFVQFNHSINHRKGTMRGLHFQLPPFSEIKLIRCISGKVYDVIVDLRKESPTFLKWYGVELSQQNMKMIYVPEGFAHGFLTLTDQAELLYHHTSYYTPQAESGLRYDDPILNIQWPGEIEVISAKDKSYSLITQNFAGLMISNSTL
jgi:dTDP-4-dehydrorhamnose 3,5-epimerase